MRCHRAPTSLYDRVVKKRLLDLLERILIPRYGELALFLMSVTFISLFAFDAGFRSDIRSESRDFSVMAWIGFGLCLLGLLFSIYHAFSRRRKSSLEKHLMVTFAVCVNAAAGISAGVHLWEGARGLLLLAPAWNILNGVLLLLLLRVGALDGRCIADEDAESFELIVGTVLLAVLFVVCHLVLDLYWAVTFSISVVYATSLSGFVKRLGGPPDAPETVTDAPPDL